jgi:UPF0716 protein FxsA
MRNPALLFLLIFVGAPLVELYLLIEVGSVIGALPTIVLSVFTAVLGGMMVRLQGFSVLFRAQEQMARDSVPAVELLEGALLLLVGIALLLPGFVTDAIGFLLLIPGLRRAIIVRWLKTRGTMQPVDGVGPRPPEQRSDRIIDGEWRREDGEGRGPGA